MQATNQRLCNLPFEMHYVVAVLLALARLGWLDLRQQIIGHRLLTVAQIVKVRMDIAGVGIVLDAL